MDRLTTDDRNSALEKLRCLSGDGAKTPTHDRTVRLYQKQLDRCLDFINALGSRND